ncbi:MAG: ankyrin repeat domain-containing protein [Candidatus Omnitrophica bacterium]|nr:ankyrin repeat domain-containing protein [Candidatus Omnitrophota bacterium]
MRRLLGVATLVLFFSGFPEPCFALWGSYPEIDQQHVKQDLIGKRIQDWTFQKGAECRIKILDAKYEKNTATLYVSIKTLAAKGNSGRKGKLRLAYEYAANDWNLLDVKPISFSQLENEELQIMKMTAGYPLFIAVLEGDAPVVKKLIASGADVNQTIEFGMTPLMFAVWKGHLNVAEILLDDGANVNAQNDRKSSPLLAALESKAQQRMALLDLLLSKGANVNAETEGATLLHRAVTLGDKEAVELFLAKGADVNAKDHPYGATPLYAGILRIDRIGENIAKKAAQKEVIKLLISKGADVNAKTNKGWTPLHVAASGGYRDIAQLLIANGARINAMNRVGSTPLHDAARNGRTDMAEFLITQGADLNAKDDFGTPLDWALKYNHKEVADLLKGS